ncbi:Ig-like domain-containing protein [Bacillus sp. 1P02SD]|uniref:Ig-like domain-containing protein n=1 Tax=Bacillus sp. 1P02SD TaxID=3132264 RepID=UPI0039A14222
MKKINRIIKNRILLVVALFTLLIAFNSSRVLANDGDLVPRGYIDLPINNSTVEGETLIKGWFLDPIGIPKIEVMVDGKSMGEAQYGDERLDVGKAFPEYQNNNSGYNFLLNTKSFSNGKHTLTIRRIGVNGEQTELSQAIYVQNPQTLPAKLYIDAPLNNSTVKGTIGGRGWFLNPSGVSKVEVLVDGKLLGQADYGRLRSDVAEAFPVYQNSNSGYTYLLDTTTLGNGKHTLTIRGVGKNGEKTEHSQVINVQNSQTLPAKLYVDAPLNNSTVKGTINGRGWFLNPSGVSKVEVLVDGKLLGQADYGGLRSDVAEAFPVYQNSNSGYTYLLDTTTLGNGKHTLTIRGVGKNGEKTEHSQVINVQNSQTLPAKLYVDAPLNNSTVKGTINGRGWFLNPSGVSKVEVLVDGKLLGHADYGGLRSDVAKAFPEYQNSNSGYTYSLDTTTLGNGNHTLTIRGIGKNGEKTELSQVINVQNPPPKLYVDAPLNNNIVKGKVDVRGWFLNMGGVSKVEVLVDGKLVGQANYGELRTDVAKAYPDYQNSNSGYRLSLDTTRLKNGHQTLTVRATGNDGKKTELNQVIQIENLRTIGYLEGPINGATVNGNLTVKGWFLDISGVSKVEVLVDGNYMGLASYGGERLDVIKAFPEYGNSNSGYTFELDTKQIPDGQHIIMVKETGNNGSTSSISHTLNVMNGNPYLYLDLRKPSNITATDIVNFFNQKNRPNSPLKANAQSFIDAQNRYGVNAQYLVAHAIWETGWDGSNLRNYKNNYYGYSAYDPCPFTCGFYFPSGLDSINFNAYTVRTEYLDETGKHYNGSHLTGMNVKYATDQNWKNGIANLMQSMKSFDFGHYNSVGILPASSQPAPSFGREIPDGQPYPTDIIITYTTETYATVNTNGLAFRSIPYVGGVDAVLYGRLNSGTVVRVLGYNEDVKVVDNPDAYPYDKRWYRILYNGQEGWVYGGGLTF